MGDHITDRIKILLVDDQPAKLLSYEAILKDLDQDLIVARCGTEALECLLKTDIAVILMDVNMPGQDGFALAETIREHPRFQDTAIIFISGMRLTDQDRLRGYELGAVDYISVPIIPELLRAKVKVFSELHRKTRQLQSLNSEMQTLSGRMLRLQDEEHRRIARELHDGLGQELSLARMIVTEIERSEDLAEAKQRAIETAKQIDNALKQVRSVSHLLHPPLLEDIGLCPALTFYVDGLSRRSGIQTLIDMQPSEFPRLASDIEIAIFRIVQEALTNVFRHSKAQHAWVSLLHEGAKAVVRVRDDGKGMPEEIVRFRPGYAGVGVTGMRQRLKELGGELILRNTNPGTLVEAIIPLAPV